MELQVEQFLVQWKMPDSGQKTLPLMHKLKALAGIVEPKRDRADSKHCVVTLKRLLILLYASCVSSLTER